MYDYSSLYSVSTDEYYDAIVNSSTFSSLIAKLPKIEDLTIDSKGSIEEARKLYDGLSDYGKQFINASDYSKLQAYEDKLKELIAADKIIRLTVKKTIRIRLREVDYEEYR